MGKVRKISDELVYQYDYSSHSWVAAPTRYTMLPARDVPAVLLAEVDLGEWDYQFLKIYDALLTNSSPLIPIKKSEYPTSMFKRDMKVIHSFDSSLVQDKNGRIGRKTRYSLCGEFPSLPDDSRRTRLLAYRLFLADCGCINMELAEKIAGKKISRRTFVRDLEFLRGTCACGILTYKAAEKIYVWESLGEEENEGYRAH